MLTGYIHPDDATADEPRCQESVDHELRVLVMIDHPAVRTGLLQLLEEQPDLTVVDAVGSAEAAMSMAERRSIDVAVVDYELGIAQRSVAEPDAEASGPSAARRGLFGLL